MRTVCIYAWQYVAWLQKSHLLRRLIEEERVNVLALDTDITVHAEPYAALRAFHAFTLVTTFDFKGGFVGRRAEGAVLAVPHLANLASWGLGLTLSATHSG